NCLKEANSLSKALEVYDQAARIDSADSDLQLQYGHLYKKMRRLDDAFVAYQLAFKYDPSNKDAANELDHFGGPVDIFPLVKGKDKISTNIIWLDVSDFIQYAKCNVSLSGIQRVIANLVIYIKQTELKGYKIIPVIPDYNERKILTVSMDIFLKIISEFDKLNVDRGAIDGHINNILNNRFEVTPKKGDVLVIAGAFWIYPNYDAIIELRKTGMLLGLFIHDLIQVRMPEYVEKAAHDQFVIQLSDILDLADFVLANSEYVAEDVRTYIAQYKNYTLPVQAVVLPTELRGHIEGTLPKNLDILSVAQTEYVICVSTIEIRKNHTLLIKCWEKLREEFGEKTPNLVFVGKWGWEIENLKSYLFEKGYLGDWLFIFNGISDTEMEYLYKHSLFSVYPSFAEGFGLPIGESLVYGKPCIASNTTSMPEVGGDFVRYINPFDWQESYPVIRDIIANRNDLMQWQERIRRDFRPKTWKQFCNEFYQAVFLFAQNIQSGIPRPFCLLPEGEFILGGLHDILSMSRQNEKIITFRMARSEGWHPANHWGVWMRRRRATIEFSSECHENDIIEIFIRFHREANRDSDPITIINAGAESYAFRLSQHPNVLHLVGRVGPHGKVTIKILARGKFPSNDEFIGWSGIAYCRSKDANRLLKTYESIIPKGVSPESISFTTTLPIELI
ncbi:glycosyltransferase family 1 protein, partial [Acetobacteraceae bacterium ESL0709]|nr:glycosyltransferase family 1 protein [Acetobacteraceae bacterium ESL0709]